MRVSILFILLFFSQYFQAQSWTQVNQGDIEDLGFKDIQPRVYTLYSIDDISMKAKLWEAPLEQDIEVSKSNVIIQVGLPGGEMKNFRIVGYAMMEPELAKEYPHIRTFYGIETNEIGTRIRIDYTEQGFRAVISAIDQDKIYIDHFQRGDFNTRIVYYKRDYKKTPSWGCLVDDSFIKNEIKNHASERIGDCQFRSYRLAQAATGEYSNFFGAMDSNGAGAVLSAVTTGINRVNELYEAEVAVRLILVNNNTSLFFYNPATDPYTASSASMMLSENITTCNANIGLSNYDIGHVFGALGNNGVAGLGVVCGSNKARGVTTSTSPVNDPFYIDYVAHEMGHQFNGNHTQNNNCNRNSSTAMEPGSASTIMGYAGICSPNVQLNSDAYFHAINLQEIKTFLTQGGASCATPVPNYSNQAPIVSSVPNFTIPKSTPFVLTLSATDPNNHPMVYLWDQMNSQTAIMPPDSTSTTGPTFRSINYTSNPSRYFPNMSTILAGYTSNTWEVVPSVGRTMNFRGVVRDIPGAGTAWCNSEANTIVTTISAAGPFLITSQNTTTTWLEGETIAINWDVAGTTGNGINCTNVDILLSRDGGQNFTTVLASGAPNIGTYNITVPDGLTTTGRIMVRGTGNIFFDVNNSNITIESGTPTFSFQIAPMSHTICVGEAKNFVISVTSILGFTDPITLSVPGLPSGYSASFTTNPVLPGNTSTLTITNINAPSGTTNQLLNGVSGMINKNTAISIISNNTGSVGVTTLNSPGNNAAEVNIKPSFSWTALSGATLYDLQITRIADFSTVLFDISDLTSTSYNMSASLQGDSEYFWRVRAKNECNIGVWSSIFSFDTQSCFIYEAVDLPITISSSGTPTINSYLAIQDRGTITDLDVLSLTGLHTYIDDLRFTLYSPTNSNVIIWDRPCTSQDNFNINFDQSATPGTWPCPPTNAGTYQPSNSLNSFNNLSLNGVWNLRVQDLVNQDGGALNSWGIKTCVNSFCRLLVDNTFEKGAGSFAAAVSCAQPGDTIRFAVNLDNDTIQLGNQNLAINKDIVIESSISRNIHIKSNSPFPVISNTASTTGLGLRIKGLKIHSSNNNIGVIDNRGRLVLDDVIMYKFPGGSNATINNRTGAVTEIYSNCQILEY
ncbi:MAG: reprolysin-like metallopeptidase [Saprospiraceae bacterium]